MPSAKSANCTSSEKSLPPILARMNAEVIKAMQDEKIRETAPGLGFEIETSTPEAARKLLSSQLDLWKNITTELGLKPQ